MNLRQLLMQKAIAPHVKRLARYGYHRKEVGDAIIDHFARTREEITPERIKDLVADPDAFLLNYRKHNQVANKPTRDQLKDWATAIPDESKRKKVLDFLSAHYLMEFLCPAHIKVIATEFAKHNFREPVVVPSTDENTLQGKLLQWA